MPRNSNQVSTYVGIAFYTADRFPAQLCIVLSNHEDFDIIELCGTVIETVNGWVESWRESGQSAAVFEPYMNVVGILTVGKVNQPPSHISASISSLGWKALDDCVDRDSAKHRYSNDYVCRALLHLCNKKAISLKSNVKKNLDTYISDGLGRLEGLPVRPTSPNVYPVIPLDEDYTDFL
ncbi:hypothetical protein BGY98DRAFT_1094616 [Russula aff. rugulosa BPL654]|nr:hypothetical protein BGY98DRAFT_1094616 [Russula aff. rugulosa BPL654]